jgi:hypothetical protein
MNEEQIKLPGLDRVKIVGGLRPIIMETADPIQDLYGRLKNEELVKVIELGIKYQSKLVDIEMGRLKAQSEVLGEMQKLFSGFK